MKKTQEQALIETYQAREPDYLDEIRVSKDMARHYRTGIIMAMVLLLSESMVFIYWIINN